ncbi:acyltransferase [Patulibacter sp. SYSU D01012]|uniref:acyltransferase n=1 Tax=Patulibacter sp. SYSU D01012 TaxID=2817381 RepID=UPI0032C06886
MAAGPPIPPAGRLDRAALREWLLKRRWYARSQRPWNRARLHAELARRHAFARGRMHGEILPMLRDGRLEIGPQAFFEDGVWLTAGERGRIRIGGGTFLNLGVMVAAEGLVDIGEHCMAANGCLITDADHRFDDPETPVPWQGFTTKGPTVLGDNVWLGANVVVTSGVTIGRRSVVGANSVVTTDIPPWSVAAGVPARVLRTHRPEA